MSHVLAELIQELQSGRLRVVDLTQPLNPETPILPLPPQWNNTPRFKIWELSRYDERGPAWYFRRPHPLDQRERFARQLRGPHSSEAVHRSCLRDRCLAGGAAGLRLSFDRGSRPRLGKGERPNPRRGLGSPPHRLVKTHRPQAVHQPEGRRPSHSRLGERMFGASCHGARHPGRWCRDRGYRRRSSRHFPAAFFQSLLHAWKRQVRLGRFVQPRAASPDRCHRHRRTSEDHQWLRQPCPRHRHHVLAG